MNIATRQIYFGMTSFKLDSVSPAFLESLIEEFRLTDKQSKCETPQPSFRSCRTPAPSHGGVGEAFV